MDMQMKFARKLPTPQEIKDRFPLSEKIRALKEARDSEIADVFTGKSDKLLLIIGPCSADNEDAVLDYMTRLRKVQDKVADRSWLQGDAPSAGSYQGRGYA